MTVGQGRDMNLKSGLGMFCPQQNLMVQNKIGEWGIVTISKEQVERLDPKLC